MEFKKIQLNGFKSFAEKTNFLIEEGLTGIVGPNGCGKSNIVESIRWVMGETSAKSMRGSGMEDVIFSGNSNKPSKNIAEVLISIVNEAKDGPVQYKNLEMNGSRSGTPIAEFLRKKHVAKLEIYYCPTRIFEGKAC